MSKDKEEAKDLKKQKLAETLKKNLERRKKPKKEK
jgi:hypothetical protein